MQFTLARTLALASMVDAAIVWKTAYFTEWLTVVDEQSTTVTESYVAPATQSSESSSSTSSSSSSTGVPNYQYSGSSSATSAVTTTASVSSTSTSASASSASSTSTLDSFAQECVDYHNKVRAIHQAPNVEWNTTLVDFAQNYLNGNCNFAHSGGPYGENIAMGYSTATAAMEAWYDEYKDYDYAAGQFGENTGHFTQMVWVSTGQLGCAMTDCGDSGNYLVCEYADERGNIIGYFTENVLPPVS